MRLGLIGCGTVACYGHIPAIVADPHIELVALSDVRAEHLQALGKKYGVTRLYTDYRELLAQPDIDAVTVTTPVGSHYPVTLAALAAGKHVFCEKPLADTISHSMELVQAAEAANRLLAVNFEMRAAKAYSQVKEIVDSGELGRIGFVRLIYNWAGGRWAGMERYRLLMTEGKGPIFDCGVHFFDLARWYTGSEFASVEADGIFMEKYPYPDHVVATCRMANGALVVVDESWVFGHAVNGKRQDIHRIDVEGERGVLTAVHTSEGIEVRLQSANRVWTQVYQEGKAFPAMYAQFAASVAAGRLSGLASGLDGLRAVEAAEAALARVAHKGAAQ